MIRLNFPSLFVVRVSRFPVSPLTMSEVAIFITVLRFRSMSRTKSICVFSEKSASALRLVEVCHS